MNVTYLLLCGMVCTLSCSTAPVARGWWSDAKDAIASVVGLAAVAETQKQVADTVPVPVDSSACGCDMVVCGNLIVTGTIICQQCPATPLNLAGCSKLKVVHGTFTTPAHDQVPVIISCSGDCAKQCNWSVKRTGSPSATSQFTVTFNPAFLSVPTVVAVPAKAGGGGQVTVDTVTQTTAVFDTNSSPDAIHFIALSCCG